MGLSEVGAVSSVNNRQGTSLGLLHREAQSTERYWAGNRAESLAERSDVTEITSSTQQSSSAIALPDDAFVMLDPAVEIFDSEITGDRFLFHDHFEFGIAVPPDDSAIASLVALAKEPVRVGTLRAGSRNRLLLDKMLTSLRSHGILYLVSRTTPSSKELSRLRHVAAEMRGQLLRRDVKIDLDAPMPLERICAAIAAGETPAVVSLRCAGLVEHRETLVTLGRLRKDGKVRMHHTIIQTADATSDRDLSRALVELGAAIVLEGVEWPAPDRVLSGVAELTSSCVPVHVLMTPEVSILSETARGRVVEWAGSVFLSGLCLVLDARRLWPAANATDDDLTAVLNAVRALEEALGDVQVVNLPSDEALIGNTVAEAPAQMSELAARFRKRYLRWRLALLKSFEGDNLWSQTPEAEEKVVRAEEDFLPNHPELLSLRPGSVVVDVCGGLGRVARRLARTVGQDGLIISIEMLRCLTERARRVACERNFVNLQFRSGLAQRIPLPNGSVEAAVNEWTGAIWELGLGPAMVREMARVVRGGGFIAVTHRLMRLPLTALHQPWIQYGQIYTWMREAFDHPHLAIVAERVWGQTTSSLVGESATMWRKQYVKPIVDPFDVTYEHEERPGPQADIYVTILARRL